MLAIAFLIPFAASRLATGVLNEREFLGVAGHQDPADEEDDDDDTVEVVTDPYGEKDGPRSTDVPPAIVPTEPPVFTLSEMIAVAEEWHYLHFFMGYDFEHIVIASVGLVGLLSFTWFLSCRGRARSSNEPTKESLTGDFTPVGICACCSSCTSCVESTICFECLWAETAGKRELWGWSFTLWFTFMMTVAVGNIVIVGLCLPCFTCLRCIARMKMRKQLHEQEENFCKDACCVVCCPTCASFQEAQFLEDYEKAYGSAAGKSV